MSMFLAFFALLAPIPAGIFYWKWAKKTQDKPSKLMAFLIPILIFMLSLGLFGASLPPETAAEKTEREKLEHAKETEAEAKKKADALAEAKTIKEAEEYQAALDTVAAAIQDRFVPSDAQVLNLLDNPAIVRINDKAGKIHAADMLTFEIEEDFKSNERFETLMIANKIIKTLREQHPKYLAQYKRLGVMGNFTMVDQYGNSSRQTALALIWNMADIEQINYSSGLFSDNNLLNLVKKTNIYYPAAAERLALYCIADNNLSEAKFFCNQLTKK